MSHDSDNGGENVVVVDVNIYLVAFFVCGLFQLTYTFV